MTEMLKNKNNLIIIGVVVLILVVIGFLLSKKTEDRAKGLGDQSGGKPFDPNQLGNDQSGNNSQAPQDDISDFAQDSLNKPTMSPKQCRQTCRGLCKDAKAYNWKNKKKCKNSCKTSCAKGNDVKTLFP